MGKRDRERKGQLIAGRSRMEQSGLPYAGERYKDLTKLGSCVEADEAQRVMYLTMGEEWRPIECPHCGTTPTTDHLFEGRPSCEEIGHPEQSQLFALQGRQPVACVFCGETPQFTDD